MVLFNQYREVGAGKKSRPIGLQQDDEALIYAHGIH
jgi:hypothetical protein